MKQFVYEQFYELVGDQLEVEDYAGNRGRLVIADVQRCKPEDARWTSFSILFKSAEDRFVMTQGTYLFRHASAGERSLFVLPRSETEYEASITLAKGEASA